MVTKPSITTSFTLSQDDLTRIYEEMRRINIFAYPSEYVIDTEGANQVGTITPTTTYTFTVRNAGNMHTVRWNDNIIVEPYPKSAEQLQTLGTLIINIVRQQPAIQQLPQPDGACL
jgi:hypothetical protein